MYAVRWLIIARSERARLVAAEKPIREQGIGGISTVGYGRDGRLAGAARLENEWDLCADAGEIGSVPKNAIGFVDAPVLIQVAQAARLHAARRDAVPQQGAVRPVQKTVAIDIERSTGYRQ